MPSSSTFAIRPDLRFPLISKVIFSPIFAFIASRMAASRDISKATTRSAAANVCACAFNSGSPADLRVKVMATTRSFAVMCSMNECKNFCNASEVVET